MKKEIIVGYKLIKPEYESAAAKIIGNEGAKLIDLGDRNFDINSRVCDKLREAGVLDLWFTPVYKSYEKSIKMGNKNPLFNTSFISFTLKVTSKGIYHNSENITDYVSSVVYWYKNIPIKFGKYDFIVDDLILSKTGCEVEKTSIKEWIAV
jgi:hypothetical protein